MFCQNLSAEECNPFRNMDFSSGTMPPLDENALDETVGIGFGPVDWNCNGVIDTDPVMFDVAGHPCGFYGSYQTNTDYDDWSNIVDVTFSAEREALDYREPIVCITRDEYEAMADRVGGLCVQPTLDPEPCSFPYADSDGDGIGDDCDGCPAPASDDFDGDGICSDVDNCPDRPNPDQADINSNGLGDVCECPTAWRVFDGISTGDSFGWRVDNAGDVNNDGYDDVIIGASRAEPPIPNGGAAYVYSGKSGEQLYRFTGEAGGDEFGISVSGAGDVNGDGFGDMIVGAYLNDAAASLAGRAYLFYGSDGPFPTTISAANADMVFDGPGEWANLGWEVEGIGDVDANPGPDLLVGVLFGGASYEGQVMVFSGQTGDLIYSIMGETALSRFGYSISPAGDINNDGNDDFLVGAYKYDDGANPEIGRVYAYSGADGSVIMTVTGGTAGDWFGRDVSLAGDLNGDDYDDIIVGAPNNSDAGVQHNGRAYVFYGRPGPYPLVLSAADADMIFTGDEQWSYFGESVQAPMI